MWQPSKNMKSIAPGKQMATKLVSNGVQAVNTKPNAFLQMSKMKKKAK